MTFFNFKENEYFSFSLNPSEAKQTYIFPLNKLQIFISNSLVRYLLFISIGIFAAITCIIMAEFSGRSRYFLSNSSQEILVLALAGLACIITSSEFAFFLWLRQDRRCLQTENERKKLQGIQIIRTKSWMSYLIFLLNMTVPLISLAALPGGISKFVSDNFNSGNSYLFFLAQLTALYLALTVFLVGRIVTLLKKNDHISNENIL